MGNKTSYLDQLSKRDLIKTLQNLQKKEQVSAEQIKEVIKEQKELALPISIFVKELSALESICKFLKENGKLNYHQIAELLHRDDRTIWTTYKHAYEKRKEELLEKNGLSIPVKIFAKRKLSVLETLVKYLKEEHELNYREIGELLHRNEKTIWTVYQRGKKK